MRKIFILVGILACAGIIYAQPGLNARSMGLGGAYHGMARGAEVFRWNPANLALPRHPFITLDIANFGYSIGNNSLNVDLYNNYFSAEYFEQNERWDDAAKQEIIGYFPDDGMVGYSRMEFTGVALSFQQFALAVNNFMYTDIRLPQSLIVIPLQGLSTEPLPFNDAEGQGILGTEVCMSVAKVLHPNIDLIKFFSVGATFKYFLGHAYFSLEDVEGSLQSSEDSLRINGHYTLLLANSFDISEDYGAVGKAGDGVGLDLGAAAKISDKLTLGFSLNNVIGSINFGQVEARYGQITYNEPGLNIDNFDNMGDFLNDVKEDSIVETRYTTHTKYEMPRYMIASANYRLNWWATFEADYQQGLNETAGNSTTPNMVVGTELRYLSFLPFRAGFGMGGVSGATYALGFGLDFKFYKLDLGFANQRGLFEKSKGINFALSQRIQF